jgi:hypothetical protein
MKNYRLSEQSVALTVKAQQFTYDNTDQLLTVKENSVKVSAYAQSQASEAVNLLEQVLAGVKQVDEVLKLWPAIDDESEEVIKTAWHNLYHYSADDDIRAKDIAYGNYQKNLLRDDIVRIKTLL